MTTPGVPSVALVPAPERLSITGAAFAPPRALTPLVVRRAMTSPARLPADIAPFVRVDITGAACGSSPASLQGYTLRTAAPTHADAPVACITAPTVAGARHALATLAQLLAAPSLRACEITDQPAFAVRGVMLDVSRCRIPTMARLFEIIDWLATLKINLLQLYTEHTFAYAGHEPAWQGWSPITPDEFVRLESHARGLGIDLAPNQNCFGHLSSWLRLPQYQHLAETHGDWMFDVWPRSGPFSLCPTDPASLEFVRGLLDELLPLSRSPFVNIGCDETYDIAFGRSAGEVRRRGRAAVYLEFVSKIAGLARSHEKRSMFWGDIALSHPECVKDIPDDMIALAWGYEPDSPFERWCELLAGRETWVCPGTSSWRSLTGRTRERSLNIASAARAGAHSGAAGFLVCDWGDLGHWQQWPIAAHAIIHAAAVAWNPATNFDPALAGPLGPWLDALGDADEPLRRVCGPLSRPDLPHLRNQSALFADLHTPWDAHTSVGPLAMWEETLSRLDALAKSRPDAGPLASDELEFTLAISRLACRRAIARRTGPRPDNLSAELAELAAWFQRLWLAHSRVGGLAPSLEYFAKVQA